MPNHWIYEYKSYIIFVNQWVNIGFQKIVISYFTNVILSFVKSGDQVNSVYAGVTYCADGRYPSEEFGDYAIDVSDSSVVQDNSLILFYLHSILTKVHR